MNRTDQALTIVCLEDDPLDAELVRNEINKLLPSHDWRHVMSEADYRRELAEANPDLILADYNLPNFDGLSALRIAHEQRPDTPFIFVSGALGEEIAIETLKNGATDYVLKNRLKRLGPAVERALAEAHQRSEHRRVQREFDAQRTLLEALINTIPDIIYAVDRSGRTLVGNQALLQFVGKGWDDLRGQRLADFMTMPKAPDRRGIEDDYLMRTGRSLANRERIVQQGGDNRWYSTSKALLRDQTNTNVAGLVCVSRDVTANRLLEEELSEISNREQRRIGSDLHDGLGQELTGLSLMLRGIETAVEREAPQLASQVTRIREVLTQAIESTRALARGLSPVNLERGGLPAALEHLARQCTSVYGLRCEYRGSLKPDSVIDETPSTHLYRIAQEGIANAAKHGHAKNIVVSLSSQGATGLVLEVKDDGKGIPDELLQHPTGMGLRLMEYRARIVGGELTIGRGKEGGTAITCFCPLSASGHFIRPRARKTAARA